VTDATASLVRWASPSAGRRSDKHRRVHRPRRVARSLGPELTIKVQGCASSEARLLGRRTCGATPALPGVPAGPRESLVTCAASVATTGRERPLLHRVQPLRIVETVVLRSRPARSQATPGRSPTAPRMRRPSPALRWPAYLPTDGRAKELLGRRSGSAGVPRRRSVESAATQAATPGPGRLLRGPTDQLSGRYRAPYGVAELPPGPTSPLAIQVSQAEPAANPAVWSPGEARRGVSLVGVTRSSPPPTSPGRAARSTVSLDRTYRSGSLGYGPLGSAAGTHPVRPPARVRYHREVEYHDGTGNVYRLLRAARPRPPATTTICRKLLHPQGTVMRSSSSREAPGGGCTARSTTPSVFGRLGRLVEISTACARTPTANPGQHIFLSYDSFGQLVTIEDDLGLPFPRWE